jgi:hypothetical protein
MARIRTVKPELFRHEGLYELEIETGLPIRISFAGLFTACDREGRFKWKPRQLKLDVLPFDAIDFSRVLDALVTRGFLVKYENSGELFGCIPSFKKHQVINNRESESELPSHQDEQSLVIDLTDDLTRQSRVSHASVTRLVQEQVERKGKEGKGREEEGKDICQQADDLTAIFDYWCSVMNKRGTAKFTEDRKRAVKARLKEGYTAAHIMQAIDGCSRSDFHMARDGKNTTVYDDLAMICKSGSQLEKLAMNIGAGSMTSGILNGYQEFVGNE